MILEPFFNYHNNMSGRFQLEYNVKGIFKNKYNEISEEILQYESETFLFANNYGERCFEEIKRKVKSKSWELDSFTFEGRSAGWFSLNFIGDLKKLTEKQTNKLNEIVTKYYLNYNKELNLAYKEVKPIFEYNKVYSIDKIIELSKEYNLDVLELGDMVIGSNFLVVTNKDKQKLFSFMYIEYTVKEGSLYKCIYSDN
jgi:DNA polymerase III delta prime subunit